MTTLTPKSQKVSGFLSLAHYVELFRKRTARNADIVKELVG